MAATVVGAVVCAAVDADVDGLCVVAGTAVVGDTVT